jgi:hypothetical protein
MENEQLELWKEHPNQMFIGAILKSGVAWVAAILLIIVSDIVSNELVTFFVIFAGFAVALYYSIMVYVSAWNMLKYKNRSPWWIWLVLLIGLIGAAILLCLENKSYNAGTETLSKV